MSVETNFEEHSEGQPAGISGVSILLVLGAGLSLCCLLSFLWPAFVRPGRRVSKRMACSRNLKSLAFASLVYASEHRYLPHMAWGNEAQSNEQVSDAFRTLYYYQYIDTTEVFLCPHSEDFEIKFSDKVLENPKKWDWKGELANNWKTPPVKRSSKMDVFMNLQLSYTMARKRINESTARSDTMILADKAIRLGPDSATGNHNDGFNVAFVDGHVEFYPKEDTAIMKRLFVDLGVEVFEVPGD